jgi:hypothetical protein
MKTFLLCSANNQIVATIAFSYVARFQRRMQKRFFFLCITVYTIYCGVVCTFCHCQGLIPPKSVAWSVLLGWLVRGENLGQTFLGSWISCDVADQPSTSESDSTSGINLKIGNLGVAEKGQHVGMLPGSLVKVEGRHVVAAGLRQYWAGHNDVTALCSGLMAEATHGIHLGIDDKSVVPEEAVANYKLEQ